MSKRHCGLVPAWQPLRRRKGFCLLATIACILFFGFLLVRKDEETSDQHSGGIKLVQHHGRLEESIIDELDYELSRPVYERPPLDPNGLGEFGQEAKLFLQGEERKLEEESINNYQINIYLSDKISLHRRLEHRWDPKCATVKYNYRSLPTTSVIIAFYNEAWSTLLRTVHSVLETSPDCLLKEVILVDDYSDRDHLKEPLQEYVSNLRKVRLIRANKREGLVRSRLLGASISTGEVLTFLDCHCECHDGWLEPVMERIQEKETAVVCPVIDVINWYSFEYLGNSGIPQIGGLDWRLVFTWHLVPEREHKRRRSPIDVIRSE